MLNNKYEYYRLFIYFNNVKRGNKLKSRKGVARMEKHFARLESAFFFFF